MNNTCEIEVNPASGYSDRKQNVKGQMDGRVDGWTAPYHNMTNFCQVYKKGPNYCLFKYLFCNTFEHFNP